MVNKNNSNFEPFFPTSETLKLGERHISSGTYGGFKIGQAMARVNAADTVITDLHAGNWVIDEFGQYTLVDAGRSYNVELSPIMAAESLVPLFMSFNPVLFHAVLSGYVAHSVTFIEPQHKNFTQDFLDTLGGNIISIPEIRAKVLDLSCPKSGLIFSFHVIEQGKIEIDKTFNEIELFNGWNKASEELFSIASHCIFSGIDFSELILQEGEAKNLPQQQHILHTFLYKFLNRQITKLDINSILHGGFDETTVTIGTALFELSRNWGYLNQSSDSKRTQIAPSQPDHNARNVLWQVIRKLHPKLSKTLIDGLIDFDNYLANWLDNTATGNSSEVLQRKSIEFAQSSHMLLQYGIYGFDWDEKQVIRIYRDLSGLQWKKSIEKASHFLQILSALFLHTSANAFTRLFESSTKETTLWSYVWEAIDNRRKALNIISSLINAPSLSKKDEEYINQLYPSFANGLANSLLLHQTAVINTSDVYNATPWLNDKKPMEKEFSWAVEIGKYSKNNPIVSEYGKNQISKYRNLYKVCL